MELYVVPMEGLVDLIALFVIESNFVHFLTTGAKVLAKPRAIGPSVTDCSISCYSVSLAA